MRIRWKSSYTPHKFGYNCDICGMNDDDVVVHEYWYRIEPHGWHICSPLCLIKLAVQEEERKKQRLGR